ncbi:MAG: FitA-like ribbon-helix-helix domain-containing protein [Galactobacter sp.]
MSALTVRKLPEVTHQALRDRAAKNGRSTEAEVRAILEAAVHPPQQVGLGTRLSMIGNEVGGVDLDISRDAHVYEAPDLS